MIIASTYGFPSLIVIYSKAPCYEIKKVHNDHPCTESEKSKSSSS